MKSLRIWRLLTCAPLACVLLACALLLCAPGACAAPAESTAALGQILELSGPVRVARGSQPAGQVLSLYQLQYGDVISVGQKGTARIVLYRTGACFRVKPGAVVVAQQQSLKPRSGPPPVADGKLPVRLTRRVNGPSSGVFAGYIARGSGGMLGPSKLEPRGSVRGEVVAHWETHLSPEQGAAAGGKVEVQILDQKKRERASATLPLTAHEWRPPAGVLKAGEVYELVVTADSAGLGTRVASTYFRILPPIEEDLVRDAEEGAREALGSNKQDTGIHLLLTGVYTQFALIPEARREYEAVLAARPNDPGITSALADLDALARFAAVSRGAK